MKHLITKAISQELTKEESELLNKWLKSPENRREFNKFVRDHKRLMIYLTDRYASGTYENVRPARPAAGVPVRRLYHSAYKVAAIFAGVLLLTSIWLFLEPSKPDVEVVSAPNHVTLERADGQINVINEAETLVLTDATGNDLGKQQSNRLEYTADEAAENLIYNTLTVPNGKQFELLLGDGTLVHLNAGTSLKYPERFLGEGNRDVYLNGEAFFEVAHDTSRPFKVHASNMEVKVLGTRFDVLAYPEDNVTEVVLVDGSVVLSDTVTLQEVELQPGYLGALAKVEGGQIKIRKVDPGIYTSWMRGRLTFRNMSFENIIRKLERQYGVTIQLENEMLAHRVINASFDHTDSIETIMTYFGEIYGIKYHWKEDTLLIK